jgi:hypothetical protein
MKYTVSVKDEFGHEIKYSLETTPFGEEKTLDDFILGSLGISEDKRKLPLKTQCPNGLEVYPSIKMKFENFGSPILGDKLETMHITWND